MFVFELDSVQMSSSESKLSQVISHGFKPIELFDSCRALENHSKAVPRNWIELKLSQCSHESSIEFKLLHTTPNCVKCFDTYLIVSKYFELGGASSSEVNLGDAISWDVKCFRAMSNVSAYFK